MLRSHQHCFHCLDDQASSFLLKVFNNADRNMEKMCAETHPYSEIWDFMLVSDSKKLKSLLMFCVFVFGIGFTKLPDVFIFIYEPNLYFWAALFQVLTNMSHSLIQNTHLFHKVSIFFYRFTKKQLLSVHNFIYFCIFGLNSTLYVIICSKSPKYLSKCLKKTLKRIIC